MAVAILCLRERRGKSTAPGTAQVEIAAAAAHSGGLPLDELSGRYISPDPVTCQPVSGRRDNRRA